uniref:Uncharacterized protein n=1 Tax=Arion vulgaris TaxID=1028688 RepID=A0A0B7AH81_9EUPU
MEFLKSFEKAQTMGLTKDEFINVWENESKLKIKVQKDETPSQWTAYGEKQDWLQTRQESRQDLHFNIESHCKQLMDMT